MTECEFNKYGCTTKLANQDHVQAHYQHHLGNHLRLVTTALEGEVEKNKSLSQKVVSLERLVKESNEKYASRLDEFEAKWKNLQAQPSPSLTPPQQSGGTIPSSTFPSIPSLPSLSSTSGSSSSLASSAISSSASTSTSSPSYSSSKPDRPYASSRPPSRSDMPSPRYAEEKSPRISAAMRSHSSAALKPDADGKERRSLAHSATEVPSDKHKSDPGYETARSLTLEDIDGYEKGILWGFDASTQEWTRGVISFRMEKNSFAEGALRGAYKVIAKDALSDASDSPPEASVVGDKKLKAELPTGFGALGTKYVAKISKNKVAIERYFEDVKMQVLCLELGKKFNSHGPPKPIQFLPAWVLEMPQRSPAVYCGLEPFVEGEFVKLSNNYGAVLSDRNTPAALSHFSWEITNHTYLVIDLQGVKDFYTDPQIHTKDGKGFGLGNLGMNGIDRFLKTHKCNAICQMLNLPIINQTDGLKKKSQLLKGTMKVPFIEDQLSSGTAIKWEVPFDLTCGEFQCVQTLTGNEDRVVSLCVTPKHLIAGCANGDLRIYNLQTLTYHTTLNAHRKSVECIIANEKYVFTSSADHSIKVWGIDNFESAAQLRDHVGEVNALCLSDKTLGYLISASFDKNIKVWSTRTMKCVNTLEGHTKAIKTLAISGSILFSASNDGCIMIWSLKYMSCLFTIDAHDGWVKTLAVKDKVLYSGAFDYLIKEWEIVNFNLNVTLTAHNDDVLALVATDKFLISASNDRSVMLWDYNTKKCLANLKGHRSGVQSLATDGKHIFSGSDDYSVKVWKFVQR